MRAITRISRCNLALGVLAAAALTLLAPIEGRAQLGATFKALPKLSDSDLTIIRKIVREDLTGKPNGTTLPWANPQSTNSGTVTLLDRFPSQGRDCRRVKYFIQPGPSQPPSVISGSYVLTSCRLADGSWKLDNGARRDKTG